jgi:hypothetical protein
VEFLDLKKMGSCLYVCLAASLNIPRHVYGTLCMWTARPQSKWIAKVQIGARRQPRDFTKNQPHESTCPSNAALLVKP